MSQSDVADARTDRRFAVDIASSETLLTLAEAAVASIDLRPLPDSADSPVWEQQFTAAMWSLTRTVDAVDYWSEQLGGQRLSNDEVADALSAAALVAGLRPALDDCTAQTSWRRRVARAAVLCASVAADIAETVEIGSRFVDRDAAFALMTAAVAIEIPTIRQLTESSDSLTPAVDDALELFERLGPYLDRRRQRPPASNAHTITHRQIEDTMTAELKINDAAAFRAITAAVLAVGQRPESRKKSDAAQLRRWQHEVVLAAGSMARLAATFRQNHENANKPLLARIVSADLEENSKRMVVTYVPAKSSDDQQREETVRTDRTDQPEGKLMADLVTKLVGSQAILTIEVEKTGRSKVINGRPTDITVRMLRDIVAASV